MGSEPTTCISDTPDEMSNDEFAEAYRDGLTRLVGLFRARGVGPDEARDLAHETVLRTLVHLRRHGRTRDDIGPLSRTIARNLMIERLRKAGPIVAAFSDDIEIADEAPGPSDLALQSERRDAVRAAVRSLNPRHRRVIELWMQGRNPAEIARELGVKRNAADAILHRARRTLASRLGPRALWGGIVLAWLRAKSQAKHTARAVASWSPDSAALAPTGIAVAAVGLVAVMSLGDASPPSAVHTPDRPISPPAVKTSIPAVADRQAARVLATPATTATVAAAPSVRPESRTVHIGVGPKRGKDPAIGVDIEFVRDEDDRGIIGPLVERVACAAAGCERRTR